MYIKNLNFFFFRMNFKKDFSEILLWLKYKFIFFEKKFINVFFANYGVFLLSGPGLLTFHSFCDYFSVFWSHLVSFYTLLEEPDPFKYCYS